MKKKYKLTNSEMILRDDGTYIPPSIYNGDYRDYEQWLSQGNTPDPADPPTEKQLIIAINDAVQYHIDQTVQDRGYDNMVSCVSYGLSKKSEWSNEAKAAIDWRDACWQRTYEIINRGAPYPTPAEVVAQLPPIVWPVL